MHCLGSRSTFPLHEVSGDQTYLALSRTFLA
jgi:hypothetical protein